VPAAARCFLLLGHYGKIAGWSQPTLGAVLDQAIIGTKI
jgi:hypothetical protein